MTDHTPEPVGIIADVLNDNGIGAPECFRMAEDIYRALGFDVVRVSACLDVCRDIPTETLDAPGMSGRMLACFDACAGIPTEQLGDVKALVEAVENYMDPKSEHEFEWRQMKAALAPFRKD